MLMIKFLSIFYCARYNTKYCTGEEIDCQLNPLYASSNSERQSLFDKMIVYATVIPITVISVKLSFSRFFKNQQCLNLILLLYASSHQVSWLDELKCKRDARSDVLGILICF